MKVAVINEVSACAKNGAILEALKEHDLEVFNVGMTDPEQQPQLTYIHTGLMAAIALNTGAVDLVVGGCGTGQGFLNSVMQYPGVFCGLILDSLDAFLFSQINDGNCLSLALNKGYGWAGDINLKYIFEKLFAEKGGKGYPPSRSESQRQSRETLKSLSQAAHKPLEEIIVSLPSAITSGIAGTEPFMTMIREHAADSALKSMVLSMQK